MIIDVHAHVFAFPKIKSSDSTTFMSAEDQIAVMNAKGVDKAIILPLNNAETPAEQQSFGEVLYICEKYPGRFIPFCNIDPRLPRRPDLIKAEDFTFLLEQYREHGCKGLGVLGRSFRARVARSLRESRFPGDFSHDHGRDQQLWSD
jgi:predicted TIM-barrel fold metal-dependent hydrolase